MHNASSDKTKTAISGKRIAVIIYNYPLGVSSSVINSILLLSQNNQVSILTSPPGCDTPPLPPSLSVLTKHCKHNRSAFIFRICRLAALLFRSLRNIKRLDKILWFASNLDVYFFARWLTSKQRENAFDIFIPVECYSLIAYSMAKIKQAQAIYYNMELLDWPTIERQNDGQSVLKDLEYQFLVNVDHVMITSPNRAQEFAKINHYPDNRISVIPTVPTNSPLIGRSNYFREKFCISNEQRIVIYSGNFQPWAQCIEIIQSVSLWPKNVVLVMHTWNSTSLSTPYFLAMSQAAASLPVFFSTEFIAYADLSSALSSADIGLLFYEAIDKNFTEILFSSNKMGEYISANLPIICSPHPSLSDFVNDNNIGFACKISDIGSSISSILTNIETFRDSVKNCKKLHFNFEFYFEKAYREFSDNYHLTAKINNNKIPCSICGNSMEIVFSSRLLNRHNATYRRCPSCGFLQAANPTWLEEAYGEAITAIDTGLVTRNINLSSRLTALLFLHFDRRAAYLDIAGGYGLLTRLMRDSGFDYYWDDKYCQNLLAIGFDAQKSNRPFAALTAFEVLEHTIEPLKFIQENLEKNGCGTLIFTTLLYDGKNAPPKNWWYYTFNTGQHISFFQKKTLHVIADKLGLDFYSINGFYILTDRKNHPRFLSPILPRLFYIALTIFARKTNGSFTNSDHQILNQKFRN